MRRRAPAAALALLAGVAIAHSMGCGDDTRVVTTTVVQTVPAAPLTERPDALPEIGRAPGKKGEVLIRANQAPKSHGPYDFEPGSYDFRFAQYAPGRRVAWPTEASSFTVVVNRREGRSGPDTQVLANVPARAGAGTVMLSGKLFVEVQSADYSYVIRFTPREGS